MSLYLVLKTIHVSSVMVSLSLFTLRGVLRLQDSMLLKQKWLRLLPHLVDTVLLTSAIALAMTIHQYPGLNAWLTAKVVGLVLYILLGHVVMKGSVPTLRRATAFTLALMVAGYIVGAAITHNPWSLATYWKGADA